MALITPPTILDFWPQKLFLPCSLQAFFLYMYIYIKHGYSAWVYSHVY